jgi:hypothetical protein
VELGGRCRRRRTVDKRFIQPIRSPQCLQSTRNLA